MNLIDYIDDVIETHAQDNMIEGMTNFQVASCTLDASVKIYSYRVDSVHSEAYKVLGGLNRGEAGKLMLENEERVEGGEEDGNASTLEEKKEKQVLRKRKKATAGSTLFDEENMKAMNIKSFDMEFDIDPLFQKTSACFDEGGAKGLLLNHLSVFDGCKLIFDSSDAISNKKKTKKNKKKDEKQKSKKGTRKGKEEDEEEENLSEMSEMSEEEKEEGGESENKNKKREKVLELSKISEEMINLFEKTFNNENMAMMCICPKFSNFGTNKGSVGEEQNEEKEEKMSEMSEMSDDDDNAGMDLGFGDENQINEQENNLDLPLDQIPDSQEQLIIKVMEQQQKIQNLDENLLEMVAAGGGSRAGGIVEGGDSINLSENKNNYFDNKVLENWSGFDHWKFTKPNNNLPSSLHNKNDLSDRRNDDDDDDRFAGVDLGPLDRSDDDDHINRDSRKNNKSTSSSLAKSSKSAKSSSTNSKKSKKEIEFIDFSSGIYFI